jgi:transcriptional regulator with XRE-family HTH domain
MNAIYLLWHERTDGLSEKVGVPQRFLEAIVNSQVSPSGELTKKIEEATGLRLDVPEKEIVAVQNEGSDYFKKEIEQLKQERDWLRKQNEDLLQIIKSFKKE